MARVQLGSMITGLAGKVAGSVFQRGNSGTVLRNNARNLNKRNALTSSRRVLMQSLQQQWGALTSDQRTAWAAWAQFSPIAQYNNPNKFLNGHQCFLQINYYRSLYGYSVLPSPVFAKSTQTKLMVTVGIVIGQLRIGWSDAIDVDATLFIVSLSPPLPPGVNNAIGRVRMIIYDNDDTGSKVIDSEYIALYGAIPAVGNRLYISYSQMDLTVGSFTNFTNEVQTL